METYETKLMKARLKDVFLEKFGITLQEENGVCGAKKGRVDLGGYDEKCDCEIGIEIKITKADLNTSNGHNHGLECSYLSVPTHLYKDAKDYLYRNNLSNVGLITIANNGEITFCKLANRQLEPSQTFASNGKYTNELRRKYRQLKRKNKTKTLGVRLTDEEYTELIKMAEEDNANTLSNYVYRNFLKKEFKKRGLYDKN